VCALNFQASSRLLPFEANFTVAVASQSHTFKSFHPQITGSWVKKMVLSYIVEVNEEKPLFQLFFLKDDEDQSVEVLEVEEIDFVEVERRLNQGESVFITHKRKEKLNTSLAINEDAGEQWYFTHF